MTGDGDGKILSSVFLEGYEIMRTTLCPPLFLTTESETFNVIVNETPEAFRTEPHKGINTEGLKINAPPLN